MATMQRQQPAGGSPFDFVRHVAGTYCKSASAFLSGTYVFTFSNSAGRTAKLHICYDNGAAVAAGRADPKSAAPVAYFLTVPPGSVGVEVPMACERITVTAGFFHSESGAYEIFWDNRPFVWQPCCTIAIAPRHSVDVNVFRTDVWPWAPALSTKARREAAPTANTGSSTSSSNSTSSLGRRGPRAIAAGTGGGGGGGGGGVGGGCCGGVGEGAAGGGGGRRRPLRLVFDKAETAGGTSSRSSASQADAPSLPGLQIFLRSSAGGGAAAAAGGASGGWVSGNVKKELPDGSLELEMSRESEPGASPTSMPSLQSLNPLEEVALMPVPEYFYLTAGAAEASSPSSSIASLGFDTAAASAALEEELRIEGGAGELAPVEEGISEAPAKPRAGGGAASLQAGTDLASGRGGRGGGGRCAATMPPGGR